MKLRIALLATLALALALPLNASFAQRSDRATVAKKKLSYCQKKGKKEKGKLFGKVKSAKFFLYTKKKPDSYFFCSESPKFTGEIAAWEGIAKTSHLRAVKNNCAVFFTQSKYGSGYDAGSHYLKIVPAKFFRKGSALPKQTQASRLGSKDESVDLRGLALSKNCVFAAGFTRNNAPMLKIAGIGDFPYQGNVELPAPGATLAELAAVKVTATSATTAQVTWTQGGVPKSYDYAAK